MGWVNNPITGKQFNGFFYPRGMQPGMLVEKDKDTYYSGEQIVSLVKQDVIGAGMVFGKLTNPNAEIREGTWKIAIVRDTETRDYHFYRQNSDGTWSHKPGSGNVRNTDDAGKIIYDPREAKSIYDEFIGGSHP